MLYPELKSYLDNVSKLAIAEDRKSILNQLVDYLKSSDDPKLNFICTHNSRRSHLSQVWAQVMAHHFSVEVQTYSGGTEATAFHPNAVAALRRAGFKIMHAEDDNPRYHVSFDDGLEPMICYSKTFDDPINPKSGFAAIMTCSEADAECPIVFGADVRIKLFYEDPKVADGTPEEVKTYDERCAQIASEMHFVFGQIKA